MIYKETNPVVFLLEFRLQRVRKLKARLKPHWERRESAFEAAYNERHLRRWA